MTNETWVPEFIRKFSAWETDEEGIIDFIHTVEQSALQRGISEGRHIEQNVWRLAIAHLPKEQRDSVLATRTGILRDYEALTPPELHGLHLFQEFCKQNGYTLSIESGVEIHFAGKEIAISPVLLR